MVEVLVDDLDGSPAEQRIQLGWNGEWRELDLSKRNVATLSGVLDKYWDVARPVSSTSRRRRAGTARRSPASRDPKEIRAWALGNGIEIPARGRIPAAVERQFNEARRSR
jgi:hypothetical protein